MAVVGDTLLFFKNIPILATSIGKSVIGATNIIFNKNNKKITSQNRTPIVGDKVLVIPTKNNSKITYIGGTCADEFTKYILELTPTNGTPYSTNSTIAIYDNNAYIVGLSGGKIGFGVFNGTGFDYVISPYKLTYATIDVASDGVVWIGGISGSTLYAIYYDGIWHQEVVDYGGGYWGYLMYPNLKLDNNDIPYILFTEQEKQYFTIKLANRVGGSWSVEPIETYLNSWGNPPTALNFDSLNRPHYINNAIYTGTTCHEYGYYDGTSWVLENIEGMSDFYIFDFYIDSDNYPHGVIYGYTDTVRVYHYYKDVGGWHIEHVGWCEGVARIKEFNGKPHIFFSDGDVTRWCYKNKADEWKYCDIDTRHATGWQAFANFEISPDGHIHVSYYLADIGYIYARR